MFQRIHKVFLTVLITAFLSIPSISYAQVDEISPKNDVFQSENTELIQNDVKIDESDIEPIDTGKIKDTVVPDPSKEGKKIVGLFLKTMALVLFCSALLYCILLFVKRFYLAHFLTSDSKELETLDLSSPSNKNDALKSFLNRTK